MNAAKASISIFIRANRSRTARFAGYHLASSKASPRFKPGFLSQRTLAITRPYSNSKPTPEPEPEFKPSKIFTFEDIRNQLTSPSSLTLIDTREPSELQTTGTIPGSLNIPITSQPDSFFISEEEFEDRYGFERPGKEEEVVFFCRAGVRSRAAAELARRAGWGRVGEFPGSWLEWEEKGGVVERVK